MEESPEARLLAKRSALRVHAANLCIELNNLVHLSDAILPPPMLQIQAKAKLRTLTFIQTQLLSLNKHIEPHIPSVQMGDEFHDIFETYERIENAKLTVEMMLQQVSSDNVPITNTLLDDFQNSPEKSNATEKATPKSKKRIRQQKHRQEAKDVPINSALLDNILHSPEKGKLDDEQSLRQEEVKVENVSLQKCDQTPSREKSNDRTSTETSKGRQSVEDGNRHIPSQQTETQRVDGPGKKQTPLTDGRRSGQAHWDDDDNDMQVNKEDEGEMRRGGRDRKQDEHRDPEKEYGNQQDQDDYREQGWRRRARDGRGRDGDDGPQHGLGIGIIQGNRGGYQGGEREFYEADWMGGYDGNQRGNRGGQRGNRGGQRGGRAVIPEIPLKQPNELPSFIREVEDNLFSCENHVSLAHCVSADFEMGKGIAVEFKKRFRGVQELYAQGKGPGNVAFLKRDLRYVYYMVTRTDYYKKPSYKSMKSSLIELKTLVQQHKVTELAMPRIGTGIDRLDWNIVLDMIIEVFEGSNVDITVYVYKPPRK